MTGLRLLFSRYFSHKRMLFGISVFWVLIMTAIMLFHEDPGNSNSDYIMCKVVALSPMMIALALPVIFIAQDTVGNRFMRSVPCAKKLYVYGIPAFSTIVSLGWSILTITVYAAFILITGRDICNISDILVLTSIFGGIIVPISCIIMSVRFGAFFFVIFYSPLTMIIINFCSTGSGGCGYGLPLWASLLICLGCFIAACAVGMIISGAVYKKGNFREHTSTRTSV